MDSDFTLTLRSDPRLLHAVRCLVRAYALDHGVPAERADVVVLAVDEACANAMRHAYENRRDRAITLTLRVTEEWLDLELCDHGRPAPPEKLRRPDPAALDAARLEPGGLGIHLIYTAFDEVEFRPAQPTGNLVRMRLKRVRVGV